MRLSGSNFGSDDVKFEFKSVGKGESTKVFLRLTAPANTGIYTARYSLAQANGDQFGHKYWINIRVSKFPSQDQLKTLAMQFIADPCVIDLLQTELPTVLSEVRQGKKISSIVEMLLEKYPQLHEYQFVVFIRPFLQSAEKFMGMQMNALISMYSFWAMTPFAQGAAAAAFPAPVAEPVKEGEAKKVTPHKKTEPAKESKAKAEKPKGEPYIYAKQLQHFEGMGFKDLKTVRRMLNKHKGSIQAVMDELFRS